MNTIVWMTLRIIAVSSRNNAKIVHTLWFYLYNILIIKIILSYRNMKMGVGDVYYRWPRAAWIWWNCFIMLVVSRVFEYVRTDQTIHFKHVRLNCPLIRLGDTSETHEVYFESSLNAPFHSFSISMLYTLSCLQAERFLFHTVEVSVGKCWTPLTFSEKSPDL